MPRATVGAADPDHVTLRHATRVLCVGLALFAGFGWGLDLPGAAPAALFAVFTLGAQADFVGSPQRRALRYLVVGLAAAAMFPLGAAFEDWPVAVVALTGLIVFATVFLAALGGPFYAARFPVIVALLLTVTTESTRDIVEQRMLGWIVGTVAITVAAIVLWPARAPSLVPGLTADVCRRASRIVAGGATRGTRAALLDASHRLRVAANAEHLHPGAVAPDERRWSELVHGAERLAAATATLAPADPAPGDVAMLTATAATLDAAATALDAAGPAVPLEPALADALDAHGAAMAAALAPGHPDHPDHPDAAAAAALVHSGLAATEARIVTRTAVIVAALVDEIRGADITDVDVLSADEKIADRPEEALRSQLRLRSLWFRNALRAAVALMVAVALVLDGAGSGHGFWIALGAFTVLRADFGTVKRSARAAVVGTAIGFAVSSVVVLLGEETQAVVWVAFALGLFFASYGSRFRPELGAAAFTVMIVSMYTLIEPAGLRTGEVRLLDVTIGAAVTLLVTLVVWPRAGRAPAQVVAGVVAAARRGLAAAIAGTPVSEPYAVVTELDRVLDVIAASAPQVFTDAERAHVLLTVSFTTNVTEFLAHPRQSAPVPLASVTRLPEAWTAVAADASRVDGALRSLEARLGDTPRPTPSPPPEAVVGWATTTLTGGAPDDPAAVSAAVRIAAVFACVHRFASAPLGPRVAVGRRRTDAGQPMRTGTLE